MKFQITLDAHLKSAISTIRCLLDCIPFDFKVKHDVNSVIT